MHAELLHPPSPVSDGGAFFFLKALCQEAKRLHLAGFYTSGFKNLAFNPESTAKSVLRALKLLCQINQKSQKMKSRHMLVWEEYGSGGLSTPGALPGPITSIVQTKLSEDCKVYFMGPTEQWRARLPPHEPVKAGAASGISNYSEVC